MWRFSQIGTYNYATSASFPAARCKPIVMGARNCRYDVSRVHLSADLTYANCRDFICTRTHHVVVMLVNGREIEGQKELRGIERLDITNNF